MEGVRRCHREVGVNEVDVRDVLYELFMLLSVLITELWQESFDNSIIRHSTFGTIWGLEGGVEPPLAPSLIKKWQNPAAGGNCAYWQYGYHFTYTAVCQLCWLDLISA